MWASVTGPGTAFVATCARLGWTVVDGVTLRTDDGFDLDLTVDPPAAVVKQVVMSVFGVMISPRDSDPPRSSPFRCTAQTRQPAPTPGQWPESFV